MSDLVAWLGEQFDADERLACAAHDAGYNNVSPLTEQRWSWSPGEDNVISVPDGVPLLTGAYGLDEAVGRYVTEFDPRRMLTEVQAKRQIVELHGAPHECSTSEGSCEWVVDPTECSTLILLALPYAARPGYDPAWAPDA